MAQHEAAVSLENDLQNLKEEGVSYALAVEKANVFPSAPRSLRFVSLFQDFYQMQNLHFYLGLPQTISKLH